MKTEVQAETLEKVVMVFDGVITDIWFDGKVRVNFNVDNNNEDVSYGHIEALKAKNIPEKRYTKVKMGLYDDGIKSNLRFLTLNEANAYQEPQTELEKLQQKLAIYRLLTKNQYNL